MRVDMKKIELWIEKKILHFLSNRNGRIQRGNLVDTLSSSSDRNWNWTLLATEQPGWVRVSKQKRQRRIHAILNRMVRDHKLKICNEYGEEKFGEDHCLYIHELSLLDRLARHLD